MTTQQVRHEPGITKWATIKLEARQYAVK